MLLSALDPDRERAAGKYAELRQSLAAFFLGRGVAVAEEQIDETLDRVSRRLCAGKVVRHLGPFTYGVARVVLSEFRKRDRRRRSILERAAGAAPETALQFELDAEIACLRRCIERLPAHARELILVYYESDGREGQMERRECARRLGISASALRLRAHRIRCALEVCVRRCLEGPPDVGDASLGPHTER